VAESDAQQAPAPPVFYPTWPWTACW